jgi:geranylgeranyl reductase family protein
MDSLMKARGYDVIVVGAGPGGTTTARQCALRGLETLLVERKEFPRYKACAGGVTQWALSALDFELPEDMTEREWHGARFYFRGSFAEAYKPFRVGILVSRSIFDHFLLQKAREAGAKVLLSTEARDFRVEPDRVEVDTNRGSFQGQCVVLAEGALGGLARRVRGPFGQKGAAMAMVTEVECPQDEIERRTEGKIHVHFDVAYRGYGWIFPHKGYYSIGVGGRRGRIGNPSHLLMDFLTKQGFNSRQKFRGHFVPAGGIRRTVADRRVLLVGDAAGFVDAFAGEGIGYAILSGKLAAVTIHEALSQSDVSRLDLRSFQTRCEADFGKRLRYAYHLNTILHELPGIFLRIVGSHDEVIDTLLNVAAWRMTYREFIVWLLARTPRYLLFGD